jgi:hypothetical protein
VEALEPCPATTDVMVDVMVECVSNPSDCSAGVLAEVLGPAPDVAEETVTSVPPEPAQPAVRSISSSSRQHIGRRHRQMELFRAVLKLARDVAILIRLIS